LRLDVTAAIKTLPVRFVTYHEIGQGQDNLITIDAHTLPDWLGDIVIARKNMGTSYHLSVVVDDAAQNITHVTRGEDLIDATLIHVLLQSVLGLHTPIYRHHKLMTRALSLNTAKTGCHPNNCANLSAWINLSGPK